MVEIQTFAFLIQVRYIQKQYWQVTNMLLIVLLLHLVVLLYPGATIHPSEFGTFQNYWKNYQNRVILIMKVTWMVTIIWPISFEFGSQNQLDERLRIQLPNQTQPWEQPQSPHQTSLLEFNLIIFRNARLFGGWTKWWWSPRTIKRLKVKFFYHNHLLMQVSIYFSRSLSPVSSAEEVFNEDDAVDFFKVQSEKEQVWHWVLN